MIASDRTVVIDSYADGLLDLDDLVRFGVITWDEALSLGDQPRHGVAWLLRFASEAAA